MDLFQWQNSYSVGVRELDGQHQELFKLINELHAAMGSGQGKTIIAGVLQRLVGYTQTHFATEERLMAQYGYPMAPVHKQAHDKFAQQAKELQTKVASGQAVVSLEVMQMLKNWLTHHIQGTDKLYTAFFVSKGLK